ncbi:hypothetical protein Pcinc_003226 [Petrolisthes cinctipes]|uniref:Uncharacterized protein n=1 Tax=Petrolisthes cinctipes TaxID=88211 RepID=A0AAE1GHN3_PETCI|nr:hypothetical protein Pcinc_003226 [Petrolisthes cinctipes]
MVMSSSATILLITIPQFTDRRRWRLLSAMKERAGTMAEPISHIVNTFYAQVEVGWAHLVPTVDGVKRTKVQRKKGMEDDSESAKHRGHRAEEKQRRQLLQDLLSVSDTL